MTKERITSTEGKEKRSPELSLYSVHLTDKLLGESEGKRDIRPAILSAYQRGSIEDRSSYWEKTDQRNSFGQQMLTWLKDGKTGIARWAEGQQDENVVALLVEVGLRGDSREEGSIQTYLNNEPVQRVVTAINTDLKTRGQEILDTASLSESESRALIFYATYLQQTHETRDTKSLIETLVAKAESLSTGNPDGAIAMLQKIVPLLAVAGEEAQYALGALVVAKAHTNEEGSREDAEIYKWNEQEKRVNDFLDRNEGELPQQPEDSITAVEELPLDATQGQSDETQEDVRPIVPVNVQRDSSEQQDDTERGEVIDDNDEKNEELSAVFSLLTQKPHEGANYFTRSPETLHPKIPLAERWRSFLLHNPKSPGSLDLGTYAIKGHPFKMYYEVGGFNITSIPFLQRLFAKSSHEDTRPIEADEAFLGVTKRYFDEHYKDKKGVYELQSTIFPFAADAAATPEEQAKVFQQVGMQIVQFYERNKNLRGLVRDYLNFVNNWGGGKWPPTLIDNLLGTDNLSRDRLSELESYLKHGQMTEEDYINISLLALPFDLARVAKAMER